MDYISHHLMYLIILSIENCSIVLDHTYLHDMIDVNLSNNIIFLVIWCFLYIITCTYFVVEFLYRLSIARISQIHILQLRLLDIFFIVTFIIREDDCFQIFISTVLCFMWCKYIYLVSLEINYCWSPESNWNGLICKLQISSNFSWY